MQNNENSFEPWQDDKTKWKFGIFYYNREDKRVMLPKKIKQLGWTLNFAHWQSWFFLLLIFLIPVAIYKTIMLF